MNARCVDAIRRQFAMRPNAKNLPIKTDAEAMVRLRPEEAELPGEVLSRLYGLMDEAGVPEAKPPT